MFLGYTNMLKFLPQSYFFFFFNLIPKLTHQSNSWKKLQSGIDTFLGHLKVLFGLFKDRKIPWNSEMLPISSCTMKVPDLNQHTMKEMLPKNGTSERTVFNENKVSLCMDSSSLKKIIYSYLVITQRRERGNVNLWISRWTVNSSWDGSWHWFWPKARKGFRISRALALC